MLPDFLGIGAQRCGTTWLYENLRSHPEIFMPETKEINFFSTINGNFDKGLKWYESFFREAPPTCRRGEITPEYLLDTMAAQRIFDCLGPIKIIAILRNPLHRAYSSYGKGLREEDWNVSFEEFVRINMDFCIDRGKYYELIQSYIKIFGRENLLIKIYEDILIDPHDFLVDIYRFLGVDVNFISKQEDNRFNIGVAKKGLILGGTTFARDLIYKTPLKASIKIMQRNRLVNSLMNKLMSTDKSEKRYPAWMKNKFSGDSEKLSKLLNRDLVAEWFQE